MDRKITEIFSPNPVVVTQNTTVEKCISTMRDKRISCLVICDDKIPVGIYTESDIVHTLNSGEEFKKNPIRHYMSAPVLTANHTSSVFEVSYTLTKHNIRHMVITNDAGEALGVVTQTDIIAHMGIEHFMGARTINSVMSKNNVTASRETPVRKAIAQMGCYGSDCVLVEDDGQAIGILTERDIATLIMGEKDLNQLVMEDVMTSPVVTVQSDISTLKAVEIMNANKMRRLVVVSPKDETLGVLLQDNIVRELESNYIDFLKQVLLDTDQSLNEAQENVRINSSHLKNILRSSTDMAIIATDLDLKITYLNPEAERIYKTTSNASVGTPLISLFEDGEMALKNNCDIKRRITDNKIYTFNHSRHSGDDLFHIESRITAIKDNDNTLLGYTLLSRDVTQRQISEEKLLLASHVYENAIEGIIVTNAQNKIISVNPAFTRITGYTEEDVIGKNPNILQSNRQQPAFYKQMWETLARTGAWQGEIWNRRKDGETYPERLTISTVKDSNGEVSRYIAVFYDITDIKKHEEEIRYQAFHDPLTGLPNRLLFHDRLTQAIAHCKRKKTGLTTMFLDIDNFKNLNDSLGHYAGDQFLTEIAHRMKECLREDDTVSRLGGDEFTILIEEGDDPHKAATIAQKLLDLFKEPFDIKGKSLYLGVSIGIAFYPNNGETAEELIKNADTAMYQAKNEGKNNFQFFHSTMEERIRHRISLETSLRQALSNNEFKVNYQPIIDLKSPENLALEVLLRWSKPYENQIMTPNHFIPVAEESGAIIPIGEWVLEQACSQAADWIARGHKNISVSVNLSARQFKDKHLIKTIERILEESSLSPQYLNIEITETVMMEDTDSSIRTLKYLKDKGIGIHVDDFGTGYSSFVYLKKFPIDVVKLDHTFMHDVVTNRDSGNLAAGMISMARGLRLKVVAEGIETKEQLDFLMEHGCDKAQGFLFHKPLSALEAEAYFDSVK